MMYMTHSPSAMRGMTLIELGVVLLILVALAGLTLPTLIGTVDNAECELTDATLQNLKSAIIGSPTSPGFVGDMNRMPYNLSELMSINTCTNCPPYNTSANHGWRGPYLSNGILDQFRQLDYVHLDGQGNPTPVAGKAIQLVLAFDGTNCNYFLLSNGPNGKPDIAPLKPLTYTSSTSYAPQCPSSSISSISPTTMQHLASSPMNTGLAISNTPQYLDMSAVPTSWIRGDDRLLFIESVDPGSINTQGQIVTNTPCNQ